MPQPPTGTITIVFTDIQGSTVLWEYFGKSFIHLLNHHNHLFRQAFEEFGGYEVKTEGDSFMVAFQDAHAAVQMCVKMQERLHAVKWELVSDQIAPEIIANARAEGAFNGIKVRMAAHTGSPDYQPDAITGRMDYFGRMVNRAARIGAVGHGGQVLLSEATWAAIQDHHITEIEVTDWGEHSFPGLEHTEHLRQVLPKAHSHHTFPPLRSSIQDRTNLPHQLDSFFGRRSDIQQLKKRISGGQRLITLLGTGGTGKTRLSQHLGFSELKRFSGGVWFCDLSSATSKADVFGAVATALRLPLTNADPEAQLTASINGRGRAMFILDNLEQVADEAAVAIHRWLQQCPQAMFIATSRRLLKISGEEVYPLEPLPTEDAVNLFFDRARAVQSDFQRTPETQETVSQLVNQLDCLSLAVELAAARIRILSPDQILNRLHQRFKILRYKRSAQTSRQNTLEGAIDWSWTLLDCHERSALAQLSVFHSGCTLDSAEEIIELEDSADTPLVIDAIEALVDHSLLRRSEPFPGHVRYRMFESIRHYAGSKLGEAKPAAELRHAEHYSQLGSDEFIESLDIRDGTKRRKILGVEKANLSAGIDYALQANTPILAATCAIALAEEYRLTGPFNEAILIIENCLKHPLPTPIKGRLFYRHGWLLQLSGRPNLAQKILTEALSFFRESEEKQHQGYVLGNLAWLHRERGNYPAARKGYLEAIAIAKTENNLRFEGVNLGSMANLMLSEGQVEEAAALYTKALNIAKQVGDRKSEGTTLGNLAYLQRDLGQVEAAESNFKLALQIAREVGGRRGEGITLANLAGLQRNQGKRKKSLRNYKKAVKIAQEVGNKRGEAITLRNMADLQIEEKAFEEAHTNLDRTLTISQEINNDVLRGKAFGSLARLLYVQGQHDAATPYFKKAIAICERSHPITAGIYGGTLALIQAQKGLFDEARKLLDAGETILKTTSKVEYGKLLCKKAEILQMAELPGAIEALEEAEIIASDMGGNAVSELSLAIDESRAQMSQN
jgi:predicted ATPase/class 3 adenylate cyclase/Tfp pilus assembly protein PilF